MTKHTPTKESFILDSINKTIESQVAEIHITPDWSLLKTSKPVFIWPIFKPALIAAFSIVIVVLAMLSITDTPPTIEPTIQSVFTLSSDENIETVSTLMSVSLLPDISIPVQQNQPLMMLALNDTQQDVLVDHINPYLSMIEKWLASEDVQIIEETSDNDMYSNKSTFIMYDLTDQMITYVMYYNLEENTKTGIIIRDDSSFAFTSTYIENTLVYTTYKTNEDYTVITFNESESVSYFDVEIFVSDIKIRDDKVTIDYDEEAQLNVQIDIDSDTVSASYNFKLEQLESELLIRYIYIENDETERGVIKIGLSYNDVLNIYTYALNIESESGEVTDSNITRSMEDNEVEIALDALMPNILTTIASDYSDYQIIRAIYDEGKYIISLEPEAKLYFNPAGKLIKTEGIEQVDMVEEEDIPQIINDYIEMNYPRLKIKEIKRTDEGYVITMTANTTLLFNLEGIFIEEVPTNTLILWDSLVL